MFDKYMAYLNGDFSIDYWSDEGIIHAVGVLEKFSHSDWILLKRAVLEKPVFWVIRCLEVIGDVGGVEAFQIIIDLIGSGDLEIRIAALEALNESIYLGGDVGVNVEKIKLAIAKTREVADVSTSLMLDSLEKKIK